MLQTPTHDSLRELRPTARRRALFAAAVAARDGQGPVVRPDLFAPGLTQAGLGPDRVIYVEAGDDRTVLTCMEEGLRHGGLGAVVGEVACLSMTASRRLQLAGNAPLAGGRPTQSISGSRQPTTRWRISCRMSMS